MNTPPLFPGPPVVLYDGDCGWCRGWAGWLYGRDRQHRLRFAPLSGPTASLLGAPLPPDSLVLARHGAHGVVLETHARAVLQAAALLGGPWRLAALAARLPRWLIDPPYRAVARRRHRLPPVPCRLPEPGDGRHLP
ncbi:MAG: DUF393 domain-containing protein [Nitrospirota bacterium]|nr:DUF393 domain-containing protein [Nitrospirota bacterium]